MGTRDDSPAEFYLPTFSEPAAVPELGDGTPTQDQDQETTRQAGAPPESRSRMFGSLLNRRPEAPDAAATRTRTSSVGDPKDAAKVVAGLVGLAFVLAAGILGHLGNRDVRRPSRKQADGFAAPVARIAARHLDVSRVTPDLIDVIEAGSAVGDYLIDGPIVIARSADVTCQDDEQDQADEAEQTDWRPPAPDDAPHVTYMP